MKKFCILLLILILVFPVPLSAETIDEDRYVTVIENGEHPLITREDIALLWQQDSLINLFFNVWLGDYHYESTRIVVYANSEDSDISGSSWKYDKTVFSSMIKKSSEIIETPSEYLADENDMYIRLKDPYTEMGEYMGETAYRGNADKDLSWEKFGNILSEIFTDEAVEVVMSNSLFKNIGGYACRQITPGSFSAPIRKNNGALVYQKDNVAFVAGKENFINPSRNPELETTHNFYTVHTDFIPIGRATTDTLWVYEYIDGCWKLGYYSGMGYKENGSSEKYTELAFDVYSDSYPMDFLEVYQTVYSEHENEIETYSFEGEPVLTSEQIEQLMNSPTIRLAHDFLVRETGYANPYMNPTEEYPVQYFNDTGDMWCLFRSPYKDGYFGETECFVNNGLNLWSDWEDAFSDVFTEEYISRLRDKAKVTEEGYVCIHQVTGDSGVKDDYYWAFNNYKVLSVKDGYAYILRYRDDVEPGLPELSDNTNNIYSLWILKYDAETNSWKLTYDFANGLTLYNDPSLPWYAFYQKQIITQDSEEYFTTLVEIATNENIPDTSDFTPIYFILAAVPLTVYAAWLIIKKRALVK